MVWAGVSNQGPGWKLGLVCAVAVRIWEGFLAAEAL